MDDSLHLQFEDKKSCLHLATNQAPNHIVGGYFDWQETSKGYYQLYENNQLKCFRAKTECLVIKAFNGDLLVTIDEKAYELRKSESHKKYSEEFDIIPEPIKQNKKYIPPMTHPWKLSSFKKQLEKAYAQHVYA